MAIITHYCLIFSMISIITISTAKSTPNSETIYDVLKSNGLPSGLFPKGITNFTIVDDGSFQVYLDEPCDAKFESEFHYEKNVTGKLNLGQIGNLTGITAQDLFLWFPVKGIRVDIPSSGVIYFDVGVVHKQLSLSIFEIPKDCVVAKDYFLGLIHNTNTISKKLGGILRYSVNWWWKNEGEIM